MTGLIRDKGFVKISHPFAELGVEVIMPLFEPGEKCDEARKHQLQQRGYSEHIYGDKIRIEHVCFDFAEGLLA